MLSPGDKFISQLHFDNKTFLKNHKGRVPSGQHRGRLVQTTSNQKAHTLDPTSICSPLWSDRVALCGVLVFTSADVRMRNPASIEFQELLEGVLDHIKKEIKLNEQPLGSCYRPDRMASRSGDLA